MAFRVILSSALMAVACGIPLPQETPASTQAIPNFAHFASFGARVAQPVILAPQPAAFPIAPVPVPAFHHAPISAALQQFITLHRAELTPFDLRLANPATHTHSFGAHPLLPIHPGHDVPHSHPPFTQHPVIDMKTGAIVSEPQTNINQALRLAPFPAPIAPFAPLTGTLAPIARFAPLAPAVANPVVNAPRVVAVEESGAPLPFTPLRVAAPAPVGFGLRARQPVVLAPQPAFLPAAPVAAPFPVPALAPAFNFAPAPAFNFAPAPAVVQQPRIVEVEQTPAKVVDVAVAAVPFVHPIHPVHPAPYHAPAHIVHHSSPGHHHVQSHPVAVHHAAHFAPHHAVHPATHAHSFGAHPLSPIHPGHDQPHSHAVHHAPHHAVHHAPHHAVHHAPHHAVHHAPAPAVHHAVHHAPHHAVHHAPHHYSNAGYEQRPIAAPAASKTYSFKVVEVAEEDREAKAIDEAGADLENAIIEEAPEQELLDDLVAEEVFLEDAPEEEIILEEVVLEEAPVEEVILEEAPVEESAPIVSSDEDLKEAPSTEQSPIEE